jgi:hypothetical protein
MSESTPEAVRTESNIHRVEHYALAILNGMAAAGNLGLADADIDYAIDLAERLAKRLAERGHVVPKA